MDVDEGKVNCHYCDETFASKDSAMKHWKEKVRQCIYYNAGNVIIVTNYAALFTTNPKRIILMK